MNEIITEAITWFLIIFFADLAASYVSYRLWENRKTSKKLKRLDKPFIFPLTWTILKLKRLITKR